MTKGRQFIRRREGVQAAGFDAATAFREALAADGVAEFHDEVRVADPSPVFLLLARGIAVLVVSPAGAVLGVFADPLRAVAHGFERTDRPAPQQRATPPQRARRRTTEKDQAR